MDAPRIGYGEPQPLHPGHPGGEPFMLTVCKLREWYVLKVSDRRVLDATIAASTLTLLVNGLPKVEASAARWPL